MRFFRIFIGAIVIAVGLLAAALVMVLGVVVYFVRCLFGQSGRRPVFEYRYSFGGGPPTPAPAAARSLRSAPGVEVIDVEVIDVDADEPSVVARK